jgi:2'-5' RNA ligase
VRLFVAGELPGAVKAALAEAQRRLGREGGASPMRDARPVKWTHPEGMHLTLRFLGETDSARVTELSLALREAVAGFSPIRLSLAGLGVFPPGGAVRVVWAGLGGEVDRLTALAAAVEEAVAARGWAREARPFHPHATLARIEDRRAGAAIRGLLEEGGGARLLEPPMPNVFPLAHVVLFESRLGSGGARYRALDLFPLKGSA